MIFFFLIIEKGLEIWAQKQKSKKHYSICIAGISVSQCFELLGFDNIDLK